MGVGRSGGPRKRAPMADVRCVHGPLGCEVLVASSGAKSYGMFEMFGDESSVGF